MAIEINDELIKQWEPKIHKLLQNTFVTCFDVRKTHIYSTGFKGLHVVL